MSTKILKLFEGTDLSEELKASVSTVFTESVDEVATAKTEALKESLKAEITAQLQEEFDAKAEAKIAELEAMSEKYIQEEVLPEIDKYLSATVNEWQADNKVAIEDGAKVALAESFLQGLSTLAESFNLDLPKSDVLAELNAKNAALQESLNSVTQDKIELVSEKQKLEQALIVSEQTAGLSDLQKDKISESVSKLSFVSESQFKSELKAIVEAVEPDEAAKPVEVIKEQANQLSASDIWIKSLVEQAKKA